MGWLWLPLLLPMITAQQRVFLKPEEPGEVTISQKYHFSKPLLCKQSKGSQMSQAPSQAVRCTPGPLVSLKYVVSLYIR